jgi:hypothetical protein
MTGIYPSLPSGETSGKTLAPLESWETVRYSISAIGPGGAVFAKETTRTSLSANLAPGTWEITVKALSATAKPVAIARGNVLLEASRNSSLDLKLLPMEGNGSFALGLSASLSPPSGSRILGSLSPLDGPAQAAGMPSLSVSFPIDVNAEASSVDLAEVPAGFYILDLRLADSRGTLAGASETVFILAGFETRGSCRLELGTPGIAMNLAPLAMEPLVGMVLPARHRASTDRFFRPSLAGAVVGTELTWKMNGSLVGNSIVLSAPADWPAGLPAFANCAAWDVSIVPSIARLDVLAREPVSGRLGSAAAIYEFASGPSSAELEWVALYGTKAVTGESLFPGSSGSTPGTDSPAPVKAVAASGKPGTLLVAGFDAASSIHAFHISERGELFRLWKDEIRINSSTRTPDRLAVSDNRQFAAAAGSSSNWLRIYLMDASGKKIATQDFSSSSPGLSGLSYVKALAFSPDSKRLYVLANSPESIISISMPESAGGLASVEGLFDLDALHPGTSLGMSALAVASDGSVAASSLSSSRVFIFAAENTGLALVQTLDKTFAGSDFDNPMSLAFVRGSSDLHILCDGKRIIHVTRVDPGALYTMGGSISLPSAADTGTQILAGADAASGGTFLIASGGTGPVFIPLDTSGSYRGGASLLESRTEDQFGISAAAGACIAGTTLAMAGPGSDSSISLVEVIYP